MDPIQIIGRRSVGKNPWELRERAMLKGSPTHLTVALPTAMNVSIS